MKKSLLLFSAIAVLFAMTSRIQAQAWVGSASCAGCHADKYNMWVASGHPYKFNVIQNGQPPEYPVEAINYMPQWLDSLVNGTFSWDDIAGVIGGYGWKSRFVGQDGHVMGTAGSAYGPGMGHNQFNFFGGEDHGWVDYHTTSETIYKYSCFKCHTTGGDTTGTWLSAVEGLGTFTEQGIGCESCHGPGGDHVDGPTSSNIDKVYEFAHKDNALGGLEIYGEVQTPDPNGDDVNFLCGTCHNRGYENSIDASGGFVKHHEQWDEFTTTKHFDGGMDCNTCHNPHKRVIWDGDGISTNCVSCHSEQAEILNHAEGVSCLDCHMPYAAKSGTKRGGSGFVGDVRSHLFVITPDTNSMFNEEGNYVKDDDERQASLSPHYACLGCHNDDPNDGIPDKTIAQAAEGAAGMHVESAVAELNVYNLGLYPNPSQGPTSITFVLFNTSDITLNIFSANGQLIYQINETLSAGNQTINWNGVSNTGAAIESGYYFVKLSAGNQTSVQKLVLMK